MDVDRLLNTAKTRASIVYTASGSVVRQIGSLFDGGSVAGLSDRQLLERFTAQRDAAGEAAFAALVSRHGPMVLDVCRQLLGDHHHAEDAFQAVFLVLARKARSIRDPDLLANWLYGVALRTAREARSSSSPAARMQEAARAMRRSGPGSTPVMQRLAEPPDQAVIDREQAEALHNEIDRLPGPFRLPVVLCYFEGLTLDEAAQRLRCPAGTVAAGWPGRATSSGAVSPAAAWSCLRRRSPRHWHPGRPRRPSHPPCATITTRAAMSFAAGQVRAGARSASATAVAQEVLRSMLVTKLKLVALAFLLVGAVRGPRCTGAGSSGWTSLIYKSVRLESLTYTDRREGGRR